MPNLDGFQVLEAMRCDPALAPVPVIVLTVTSYVDDALSQYGTQVSIHHPVGLSSAEVLACLCAVIPTLRLRLDGVQAPPTPA
jgi:CheY-like chemotaxis protein